MGDAVGDIGDDEPVGIRHRSAVRTSAAGAITVLAALLVLFPLNLPNRTSGVTPVALVHIPLEGLVLVALAVFMPRRVRGPVATIVGMLLGLVTIVKVLDLGFLATLGRPFNPLVDWSYFGSAEGLLTDSIGQRDAIISLAAAGLLGVAILIFVPLSVLRLAGLVDRHRRASVRALAALGVGWILCAVSGVRVDPGAPVASTLAVSVAADHVSQVRASIRDERTFAKVAAVDHLRNTAADDLLTGLRGKDVIVAFVESYGRVAVEGSTFSPRVDSVLDAGTSRLRAAGFSSQSAFLTSPTFGGISWLAHSTFQSGLWVDNQLRYNHLVASERFTLSAAFHRAGWRTVDDVPSNQHYWPEGRSFYDYDEIYDARNVGYVGPRFSYATMPDQYIWSAFQRQELARPDHAPIMAEIDLVSSHTPWAPLPYLIDWSRVGDGSVFDTMPAQGQSPDAVWPNRSRVRAAYGRSIEYSLNAVISFVQSYHDDNLVLIVLGDHQPATIVSGEGASHDVPITIIAHDPAVMDRISGWSWSQGLRPGPNAPVWPMDAFRDRFLTAYSSIRHSSTRHSSISHSPQPPPSAPAAPPDRGGWVRNHRSALTPAVGRRAGW